MGWRQHTKQEGTENELATSNHPLFKNTKKRTFRKKTFLKKYLLRSVCLDIKNLITALWKKVDCISLCSKLFSFQSWPICVITFVKSIQFASNFLSIMALACWQPRRVLSSLDSCIMKL